MSEIISCKDFLPDIHQIKKKMKNFYPREGTGISYDGGIGNRLPFLGSP